MAICPCSVRREGRKWMELRDVKGADRSGGLPSCGRCSGGKWGWPAGFQLRGNEGIIPETENHGEEFWKVRVWMVQIRRVGILGCGDHGLAIQSAFGFTGMESGERFCWGNSGNVIIQWLLVPRVWKVSQAALFISEMLWKLQGKRNVAATLTVYSLLLPFLTET